MSIEDAPRFAWRGFMLDVARHFLPKDDLLRYVDLLHSAEEPVPFGWVHTLEDVYRFEPVPPRLAGTPHAANIIGTQAKLWTEVAENRSRVDYQAFPRLVAFAEVAWSELPDPDERDFDDFERRMNAAHYARLDAFGVDYRPPTGPHP